MINLFRRRNPASTSPDVDTTYERLRLEAIEQEVAADVERARFPAHSPELLAATQDRAAEQIRAVSALPLDPDGCHSDRIQLERLDGARGDASRTTDAVATARAAHEDSARQLATFAKPLGFLGWLSMSLGFGVTVALIAAAIAGLLWPSIDTFLLRSYIASIFDADYEQFSSGAALTLAMVCAAGLLTAQLVAVAARRGRLGALKIGFILCDIGVALGFAVMRLAEHFSYQAAAVSLFELALDLTGTLALFALATRLEHNTAIAERYRLAAAETKAALKLLDAARTLHDAAEARFMEQLHMLATREEGVRRAERLIDLAKASAKVSYTVSVSKLIAEAAENSADETLTTAIDTHLSSGFARERQGRDDS